MPLRDPGVGGRYLTAIAFSLATHSSLCADARFIDVAPEQDFAHTYSGGWEHFVGGGVAVLDCNGDALPDLFVAGGESRSKLLVNVSEPGGRALRFDHRPSPSTDLLGVIGAYPLDFDNDAVLDLVVLRVGENALLKGDGECRFTSANDALGFMEEEAWTTAFSATWEDGHNLPTLAFGNYVDRSDPAGPFEACAPNWLYRPTEGGYASPILLEPGHCALSMLFSDWSRAGRADLRVSNDRHYYVRSGAEQLWRMDDTPTLFQASDGWKALRIWGMGIASRDLTGDGLPEVFLTSMADQKLGVLDDIAGVPSYHDEAYARGMTAHIPYIGYEGRPSSGWHAAFGDVDNDGLDDLFIAKGNVDQMPDSAMQDPNNLLMQRRDGTFEERGLEAGLASAARGRGAALVDLNADGKLDIVVVNRRAPLELMQNVTEGAGNWLKVELSQAPTNRFATGAWIEVRGEERSWHREITVGGGHAGGVAAAEHFGLGSATSVQVRVIWPHGATSEWLPTAANRVMLIDRRIREARKGSGSLP